MKIIRVLQISVLSAAVVATVTIGPGANSAGAATPSSGSASMAGNTGAAVSPPRLTKLVVEATHQTTLGISYLYAGGHGARPAPLNSHVDCSGFIRELYSYAFGVDIGSGPADNIRTSGEFTRTSHPVPGDVALFGNNNSAPAFHGGIYVGTINGHPAMVAAPATGQNIKMQPGLDQYWAPFIMGYWHFKGATAADSGSAVRPRVRGSFDAAVGVGGGVSVSGWVVDPARVSARATVAVTIDGRWAATLGSSVTRADVNRTLGVVGVHGFSTGIPARVGRHTVCLTALPVSSASVAAGLGCQVAITPGLTSGAFDSARGARRLFSVAGWSADLAVPSASNVVRVLVDGATVAGVRAGSMRSDVNRVLRISGGHGFSALVAARPGRHTVCVVSMPLSGTSVAHGIGCKTVTVSS